MTARHFIFGLLAIVLIACGQDWQGMDCPATPVTVTYINHVITADAQATCLSLDSNAHTLERGGACISCSISGGTSVCSLYSDKPQAMEDRVLGHELKHALGCVHSKYF